MSLTKKKGFQIENIKINLYSRDKNKLNERQQ